MIRAVFLDMDDTLYSHTISGIPASATEAIQKARENGIKVFLATGRHKRELEQLVKEELPLDGFITVNGAYSYQKDRVLDSHPISQRDMESLYAFLQENHVPVVFLEDEKMYINMHDDLVQEDMDKIHTAYPDIEPLERILQNPIYQFIPYVNDEIWNRMNQNLKDVQSTRWNIALDVVSKDAGKDIGIRRIAEINGWKKEEIMAIGDGPNDVSMLKAAGVAVCMGNGTDSCKSVADYVTDVIDEGGIMHAFKHFGLIY